MRNFLALDLGSKTGFCVFSENKEETRCLESGTKNFNTQKKSSLGRRFVCFRDWLRTLIHKYEIKGVYYEQVYGHTGVQAARVYGGFLYHLAAICDDFNIPMRDIGVGTIKKKATGYGHASKEQVINAVEKYNFYPLDDNEADAIAIMLTVINGRV